VDFSDAKLIYSRGSYKLYGSIEPVHGGGQTFS